MIHTAQIELPFACLDFSGRDTVRLDEIARKLGVSLDTLERLVDDGSLVAVNLARHTGSRRLLRVAVDEYRRFVLTRLTGPARAQFIDALPKETLRELRAEIDARLAA